MAIVGRAYVTVRAITAQLDRDISDGVNDALNNLDDDLGSDVGDKIGKNMGESVSDSTEKTVKDRDPVGTAIKDSFDEKSNDYDRIGNDLGDHIWGGVSDSIDNHPMFQKFVDAWDDAGDDAGNRSGARFRDSFGKVMGGIGSAILPTVLVTGLPLLLEEATSGIGALIGVATELASTLGPVLAAGAGVGAGAMTAMIGVVGTLTLALKSQNAELDTFKASLDPVVDRFRDIGQSIQQALLPRLSENINAIVDDLGPTLRTGLTQTADAIANVTDEFAEMAASPIFQAQLGSIMRTNAGAIENFGGGLRAIIEAAVRFTDVSGPLITRFSEWAENAAKAAEESLQAADESGRLDSFLARAGDTAAQFGRILGDLGRALGDVFSAAAPGGATLLDNLEDLTAKFEEWTSSVEGNRALTEFFERSNAVGEDFVNLIAAIGRELGQLEPGGLSLTLQTLTRAVPAIGQVVSGLAGIGRNLLAEVLPPITAFAQKVIPAVESAGVAIGDELGEALDGLSAPLADVAISLANILESLAPVIGPAGSLATILATLLAPALRAIAEILDALPNDFVALAGAIVTANFAFNKFVAGTKGANLALNLLTTSTGQLTTAGRALAAVGWVGIAAAISQMNLQLKTASNSFEPDQFTSALEELADTGRVTGSLREIATFTTDIGEALSGAAKITGGAGEFFKLLSSQETQQAKENVEDLDQSLADLAAVDPTKAIQAFVQIRQEAADAGVDFNDMNDLFDTFLQQVGASDINDPLFADAIERAEQRSSAALDRLMEKNARLQGSFRGSAGAFRRTGDGLTFMSNSASRVAKVEEQLARASGETTSKTRSQTAALRGLTNATIAYHEAASKLIAGNIALEQAIDDANKEIREGKKTLDINTQAGRDNYTALLSIADAAGQVTGSAEHQAKAMDRARNKIITYAKILGFGQKEAEKLANRLISVTTAADDVDKSDPDVHIDTNADQAEAEIQQVSDELSAVDGRIANATILVHTQGGAVISPRSSGGWIHGKGGPTDDANLYAVSDTEFITRADRARKYARLLEAINFGTDADVEALLQNRGRKEVTRASIATAERPSVALTIVNPAPERASDSVMRNLTSIAQLGLFDGRREGGR